MLGQVLCLCLGHTGQLSVGVISVPLIPLAWILKTFKIYVLRTLTLKCMGIFYLRNDSTCKKSSSCISPLLLKQILNVWLVLGWYPVRRSEWKKLGVSSVAGRINSKPPGEPWSPPLIQYPAGTFFLTLGVMSFLALSNLLYVPH